MGTLPQCPQDTHSDPVRLHIVLFQAVEIYCVTMTQECAHVTGHVNHKGPPVNGNVTG